MNTGTPNVATAPGVRGGVLCLRIAVCAMCVGASLSALRYDNAITSTLFMNLRWPYDTAVQLVDVGSWVLLVAAGLCWFRRTAPAAAWVIAVWMGALMLANSVQSVMLAWVQPFAEAVRFLGPAALALMAPVGPGSGTARPRRFACGVWLLRIAAAGTFFGHGVEALSLRASFVDLLMGTVESLFGMRLGQDTVEMLLPAIGAIDIALAGAILVCRSRVVAAYMALWGVATAASRIVHAGLDNYLETLLRTPNGGVPLVLFLFWYARRRSFDRVAPR